MADTKENLCIELHNSDIDYERVHHSRMVVLETISFLLYENMCREPEIFDRTIDLCLGLSLIDRYMITSMNRKENDNE